MIVFKEPEESDIDRGVREYGTTPGAVLLDVRSPEEYDRGHIPGSRNLPLPLLDQMDDVTEQKDAPIFVYCHSGMRSGQAQVLLGMMGYTRVKNIGGIIAYSGAMVR